MFYIEIYLSRPMLIKMKKLIILFLIFTTSVFSSENSKENCCNSKELDMPLDQKKLTGLIALSTSISNAANNPTCFSSGLIKKNKVSPEKQLAQIMQTLSDEEIYTRLILAETLASTCPSESTSDAIAWVIKNRINAKNASRFGIGRDIVFKDYQFRSSTGDCDVAKRDVFMCPSSIGKDVWRAQWLQAQASYKKTLTQKNPIGPNSFQYFFLKHFDKSENCSKWKGVNPAWATSKNEVNSNQLNLNKACIKVYK